MRTPLLALLFAAACTGSDTTSHPMVVFDLTSVEPYAVPWPGDQDRDADGTISFGRFARPLGVGLVESYVELGEQELGWGNNAPIYLTTDRPIDPTALPTPADSLFEDSPLVLVDVDPDSPYLGERFPVVWRVSGEVSAYQPENLLAVAPAPGFPLRPSTTYALLLTRTGFDVNPAFQEVFDKGHPHAELWKSVRSVLGKLGLKRRDLAGGTVFTTGDPIGEMATLARFVQARLAPPDLNQRLELLEERNRYTVYRTEYPSPVFTHGVRPYTSTGGEFRFDASGGPLIASWDDMRLAVCVPTGSTMPESGWPVVIYQHGTGGSYRSPCNSNGLLSPGGVVANAGFVTLGIDQPLHGPRNNGLPTSDLANFNILNPVSGRTNFRQGAVDALYLARALSRQATEMRLPDGAPLRLDPQAITFVGHSQGGLTGALAAPFWSGDVDATVLSGAGGLLAITVVDRKDIVDFAALVASIAQFTPDETVHELHPVLGVVQMLVEPTDPINYAPFWYADPLDHPGHTPTNILLTNGTLDANTPYRGAIALAAAGRLPPIAPRATPMPGIELRDLDDAPSPATLHASGYDRQVTSGFSQWYEGSHFVIFEEPRAADLYQTFLRSAVDDRPTLELLLNTPEWAR